MVAPDKHMFPVVAASPSSSTLSQPSVIVVGLGNPILGDDGVGWKVAEEVSRLLEEESEGYQQSLPVVVECCSLGGLNLMELLIGYDRAIIIDAFGTNHPEGTVLSMSMDDLTDHSSLHTTSAHDTSLKNAMNMGKAMGACLPRNVSIVGVVSKQRFEFSEELTPVIAAAVPAAAQLVLNLIHTGDKK